jgi:DNA polymerase III subunit gamma/tau
MSNFVVSARKYRPQRFEDVIGQNHIAKTLKKALETDKLAHAFLFCGPRGVGKTTCARILAKVINCLQPVNKTEPCNTCSSCKSFNENASFNILELDAASNNSVEHIRTLIEQVRFQPQQGSHKVFIIDEVHMLSTQAFNAFLKTLEEPPPYAIFILATTEKNKILPTILSRCQIFDFKRIMPTDVVEQLQKIVNEQGRTADPEALHQIGVKADGAMRDALSIYDKIASATEGNITYKDVVSNLNILDYEYFFKITDACVRSDLKSNLLILDEIIKNGFDVDLFVGGLSDHFRMLLLSKDPETAELMEVSEDLKQRYFNQANICTETMLISGLNILNQCDIYLPRASNKRISTEVALMKITYLAYASETDSYGPAEEKKTSDLSNSIPAPKQNSDSPTNKSTVQDLPKEIENVENQLPTEVEVQDNHSPTPAIQEISIEETPLAKPEPKMGLIDVNYIREQVLKERDFKKQASSNFNLESVKALWEDYSNNNTSQGTKSAMSTAIVDLEGKSIIVKVPNAALNSIIVNEKPLMDRYRSEFGIDDLTLNCQVDLASFPDYEEVKFVTPKSQKELFEDFAAKNPAFIDLVQALDLRLE